MLVRIITRSDLRCIKVVLNWLNLYHPSLTKFRELMIGSPETLADRSIKFSSMLDGLWINGVDKRTGPKRLEVLDKWLISFLNDSNNPAISILDVGGSDGITTLELIKHLQEYSDTEINATILEKQLRLYYYKRGCINFFLTSEKKPFLLQLGIIGILLEERTGRMSNIFNPIARFLQSKLKHSHFEKHFRRQEDILFINPQVKESPNLSWIEQDLFLYNKNLECKYDIIRCSNILNIDYFNQIQIGMAFQILSKYLKPNGLLTVSRSLDENEGSSTMASIWRKSSGQLILVSDLNGGSEVKSMVE